MLNDEAGGVANKPSKDIPNGLWRTSSIAFDAYLSDSRIVASFGFNFFQYGAVSDSVLPDQGAFPHYGQVTNSTTVVQPFIRLGYRLTLGEHFFYEPSISIGWSEVLYRYKAFGTPYESAGQIAWDNQNRNYEGFSWFFTFDKRPFMFELGNNFVYDLNRWSFSGGLSYYFYRNLPIIGYNGLHLNIGCSVRLGE